MTLRTATLSLLGMVVSMSFVGASCGQSALALMPGVVNDPRNLSLRREILRFGTANMCAEMMNRSLPLRLRDDDPVTGRFYPSTCFAQDLPNEHLFVQFGGQGYAWTNLTKRMGFEAGGAIEYEQDFLMDGDTMYVYFRQKSTSAATFKAGLVEQPVASALGSLPAVSGQTYAAAIGTELLKSEATRGFTVIRRANGQVEFGLGVVEKGAHPTAPDPYRQADPEKQILVNERTEIHQEQRDFAGPFTVPDDGKALYVTVAVEGAPAIDVFLVPRADGQAWLGDYVRNARTTPLPTAPWLGESVTAGGVLRRTVRVPKGQYFLVLDNTSTAGTTQPVSVPGDDRAALVSYAVELGRAP
jgi:hypothetical protein